MAFWIQERKAMVTKFKSGENMKHEGKVTTASLSTSEKDMQNEGKFVYSNWPYTRFVGKAHQYMLENVKDGDLIVVKSGKFSRSPYKKDGETVYPKNDTLTVFDVELVRSAGASTTQNDEIEVPDPEEIPF